MWLQKLISICAHRVLIWILVRVSPRIHLLFRRQTSTERGSWGRLWVHAAPGAVGQTAETSGEHQHQTVRGDGGETLICVFQWQNGQNMFHKTDSSSTIPMHEPYSSNAHKLLVMSLILMISLLINVFLHTAVLAVLTLGWWTRLHWLENGEGQRLRTSAEYDTTNSRTTHFYTQTQIWIQRSWVIVEFYHYCSLDQEPEPPAAPGDPGL